MSVMADDKSKLNEFFSDCEAMIDFHQYALRDGDSKFNSADRVMDMLVRACKRSMFDAMREIREKERH